MPVEDFNHYNLRAPRPVVEALREFYTAVVGLKEGFRPPFRRPGYWLYAGDRDILHLSESRPGEVALVNAGGTLDHVAFRCTDEAAYRATLTARGIPCEEDDVPLTGELQFFLRDPAGNLIELNFRR